MREALPSPRTSIAWRAPPIAGTAGTAAPPRSSTITARRTGSAGRSRSSQAATRNGNVIGTAFPATGSPPAVDVQVHSVRAKTSLGEDRATLLRSCPYNQHFVGSGRVQAADSCLAGGAQRVEVRGETLRDLGQKDRRVGHDGGGDQHPSRVGHVVAASGRC